MNQRHLISFVSAEASACLGDLVEECAVDLAPHTGSRLLARLQTAHRRLIRLVEKEERLVEMLSKKMLKQQQLWSVPRLSGEIHDIAALREAGKALFQTTEFSS